MAADLIVDDGIRSGAWAASSLGGYEGDSYYTSGATDTDTFQFSAMPAGTYDILVNTPGHSNSTNSAEYTVKVGGQVVQTFGGFDQRPGTAGGWVSLGQVDIATAGTFEITVRNTGTGNLRADAMRATEIGPSPAGPTVDDGAAGYSETAGTWQASGLGGVEGDSRFSTTAGASATFAFSGLAAGQWQEVFVNNPHDATSTTAAVYTVSSGGTTLGKVTVDQRKATGGWLSLGTYFVSGTTLDLSVTNGAAGALRTDAARVVAQAAAPTGTSDLVDNGEVYYSEVLGSWFADSSLGGVSGDSRYSSNAGANVTFSFTNLKNGLQEVFVNTPGHSNSTPAATYTISSAGQTLGTITIDQRLGTSGWLSLGTYDVAGTSLQVTVTNAAGTGNLRADAVQVAWHAAMPAPTTAIDDGSVYYLETGSGWATGGLVGAGYLGDYRYHAAGSGGGKANWTFVNLADGEYEVQVTWVNHPNRAINAPYTVFDGTTSLATVSVNQVIPPAGSTFGSVTWRSLGTYTVTNGMLRVELGDNASGYVVADGARIIPVTPPSNTPPTTSGIPDVTVYEDAADEVVSLFDHFADAEDSDAQLTFAVQTNTNAALFTSAAINAANGQLTLDFAPNANGIADITVRATDAGGLYVEDTFRVTVVTHVEPPTLSVEPLDGMSGSEVSLEIFAELANPSGSDTLTVNIAGLPVGATLSAGTENGDGSWTLAAADLAGLTLTTPIAAASANYVFTVTARATDPLTGAYAETVQELFVLLDGHSPAAPNLPPAFVGSLDATIEEYTEWTGTLVASDPEDGFLRYDLVSGSPEGMEIDPFTGEVTWTPGEEHGGGDFDVGVSVTDGWQTVYSTMYLHVTEQNSAPVFDEIENQIIEEGTSLGFYLRAEDPDSPTTSLFYSIVGSAIQGMKVDGPTGYLTWTPVASQVGQSFDITVLVTDKGSPDASNTAKFTVAVANTIFLPPTISVSTPDPVEEGEDLSFTVSASDPDTPTQDLRFFLAAGAPTDAKIDPEKGEFHWTPGEADGARSHVVRIVVTDEAGNEAYTDVTIVVDEHNDRPTLTPIDNQTVSYGSDLVVFLEADDVDDDKLTYSIEPGAPAGVVATSDGRVRWRPDSLGMLGKHKISVSVSDGKLSEIRSFEVTVVDSTNNRPTLHFENFSPFAGVNTEVPAAHAGSGYYLSRSFMSSSEGKSTYTFDVVAVDDGAVTFKIDVPRGGSSSVDGNRAHLTWVADPADGTASENFTIRVSDGTYEEQIVLPVQRTVPPSGGGSCFAPSAPLVFGDEYPTSAGSIFDNKTSSGFGWLGYNDFGVSSGGPSGPSSGSEFKIAASPDHGGTVKLDAKGTFTYEPASGFAGTEYFSYTVKNLSTGLTSNVAYVAMQVAAAAPEVDLQLDGMFVAGAGQPQQALLRLNDDYDRATTTLSGRPLRDLEAPRVSASDNELVSGRFRITAAGATGQWSLDFSTRTDQLSGGLRLWRKQANGPLIQIDPGARYPVDAIPPGGLDIEIVVEGTEVGNGFSIPLTATFIPKGGAAVSKTVNCAVVNIELTLPGQLPPEGWDRRYQPSPELIVELNDGYEEGANEPDHEHAGIAAGDPQLESMQVLVQGGVAGVLTFDYGAGIKIYNATTRTLLPANPIDALTTSLLVEGLEVSQAIADKPVKVMFQATGIPVAPVTDELKLTVVDVDLTFDQLTAAEQGKIAALVAQNSDFDENNVVTVGPLSLKIPDNFRQGGLPRITHRIVSTDPDLVRARLKVSGPAGLKGAWSIDAWSGIRPNDLSAYGPLIVWVADGQNYVEAPRFNRQGSINGNQEKELIIEAIGGLGAVSLQASFVPDSFFAGYNPIVWTPASLVSDARALFDTANVNIFGFDMTGSQSGTMAVPGAAVVEKYEEDPFALITAVNTDDDNPADDDPGGRGVGLHKTLDNADAVAFAGDNDFVRLLLRSGLPVGESARGTLKLKVENSAKVQLFLEDGTQPAGGQQNGNDLEFEVDVEFPIGPFEPLASNGFQAIFVEALDKGTDLAFVFTYVLNGQTITQDRVVVTAVKTDLEGHQPGPTATPGAAVVENANAGDVDEDNPFALAVAVNNDNEYTPFLQNHLAGRRDWVDYKLEAFDDDLVQLILKPLDPQPTTGSMRLTWDSTWGWASPMRIFDEAKNLLVDTRSVSYNRFKPYLEVKLNKPGDSPLKNLATGGETKLFVEFYSAKKDASFKLQYLSPGDSPRVVSEDAVHMTSFETKVVRGSSLLEEKYWLNIGHFGDTLASGLGLDGYMLDPLSPPGKFNQIPVNGAGGTFIDTDPDRFVIQVTDYSANLNPLAPDTIRVEIGTQDKLISPRDKLTEIVLTESGANTGIFRSESQLLVPIDLPGVAAADQDDAFAVHSPERGFAVADEGVGDRTHQATLDDTVQVSYTNTVLGRAHMTDTPVAARIIPTDPDEMRGFVAGQFGAPRDVTLIHPGDDHAYVVRINAIVLYDPWDDAIGGTPNTYDVGEKYYDINKNGKWDTIFGDKAAARAEVQAQVDRANIAWSQGNIKVELDNIEFFDGGTKIEYEVNGRQNDYSLSLDDVAETAKDVVAGGFVATGLSIVFSTIINGANGVTAFPLHDSRTWGGATKAIHVGDKTVSFVGLGAGALVTAAGAPVGARHGVLRPVDTQTLAHELGHALTNWDPDSTVGLSEQYLFYPSPEGRSNAIIGRYRRITHLTERDARTRRAMGKLTDVGNLFLRDP